MLYIMKMSSKLLKNNFLKKKMFNFKLKKGDLKVDDELEVENARSAAVPSTFSCFFPLYSKDIILLAHFFIALIMNN